MTGGMARHGGAGRRPCRRVLGLGALLALGLVAFSAEAWLDAPGHWLTVPSTPYRPK